MVSLLIFLIVHYKILFSFYHEINLFTFTILPITRGYETSLIFFPTKDTEEEVGVRTQHEGVIRGTENREHAPALMLSLSHPLLPAVGAQNLELRENVKDIKSVGSDPSCASESPGKLAKLQARRSRPWRGLSLVGNGTWGPVCLASTQVILTQPALPGPWSGSWSTCCGAALALLLIRCRLSSSSFSKCRCRDGCSLLPGATHSTWGGPSSKALFLIHPDLLPRVTQKDCPSFSLWPAFSCNDSFPVPSRLILSSLYVPAPSQAFQMSSPCHRSMGGKPRGGAQQWVLGTHTLKNPKLIG